MRRGESGPAFLHDRLVWTELIRTVRHGKGVNKTYKRRTRRDGASRMLYAYAFCRASRWLYSRCPPHDDRRTLIAEPGAVLSSLEYLIARTVVLKLSTGSHGRQRSCTAKDLRVQRITLERVG